MLKNIDSYNYGSARANIRLPSLISGHGNLLGTNYPILEVEVYEFVSHYSRWFDPVNSFVSFATTAPPLEHYLMWIDSNPTGPLLHLW